MVQSPIKTCRTTKGLSRLVCAEASSARMAHAEELTARDAALHKASSAHAAALEVCLAGILLVMNTFDWLATACWRQLSNGGMLTRSFCAQYISSPGCRAQASL